MTQPEGKGIRGQIRGAEEAGDVVGGCPRGVEAEDPARVAAEDADILPHGGAPPRGPAGGLIFVGHVAGAPGTARACGGEHARRVSRADAGGDGQGGRRGVQPGWEGRARPWRATGQPGQNLSGTTTLNRAFVHVCEDAPRDDGAMGEGGVAPACASPTATHQWVRGHRDRVPRQPQRASSSTCSGLISRGSTMKWFNAAHSVFPSKGQGGPSRCGHDAVAKLLPGRGNV